MSREGLGSGRDSPLIVRPLLQILQKLSLRILRCQGTITRHKNICRQHTLIKHPHPSQCDEEVDRRARQATLHHLSAVQAHWGCPRWLKGGQCDTHPQKGPEEGSGKLQDSQPQLSAGQDYGTDHLECHHMAPTGWPRAQTQPAWI